MQKQEENKHCSGLEVVEDESTKHGSGNIEEVNDNVPSEDHVERLSVSNDGVDNSGRVDTERIADEIVDEPKIK